MAAGDVTIQFYSGRDIKGARLVAGKVQLDGSNPTPVALGSYMGAVLGATVTPISGAIPVDAMMGANVGVSGTTLNVYAWGTNGSDPTPTASTNNAIEVAFVAWGTP